MGKRKTLSEEEKIYGQKKIIAIMSIISAGLIMGGIAMGDAAIMGNLIMIAIFLTAVPYFFFKYSRYLWVKSLEPEFPNFIRDLADAIRSMPLPEAMGVVSKSNYGNLTGEIKKMHNRMSWGTPFLRTLEIFGEKVRGSNVISEALMILRESFESGGNMVSTLESISKDMLMLREADQERSSMMKQHIMVMYGIFFMFLGISILIIFVMVPMIASQSNIGGGLQNQMVFSNPCPPESAWSFPCGLYIAIAITLGISAKSVGAYYISMFFSSLVVLGVFIGLITGQLGENSIMAGIKHSIIMVVVVVVIFLFFAKTGMLPT